MLNFFQVLLKNNMANKMKQKQSFGIKAKTDIFTA